MSQHDGRTSIFDIFDQELFNRMVEEGFINVRRHPTLALNIANYSDSAAYGGVWNSATEWCRGLIYDDDFKVVAKSWRKFFNLGQRDNTIDFHAPVEVTDKLDGSLGILYPDGEGWAIATRGSFESDQAIYATREIWKPRYNEYYDDLLEQDYMDKYTLLFEIIIPWNRIVCNYGDMEDLVLLGAVEKEYNYYIGPREAGAMFAWPGPVAEVFEFDDFADAISNWPQREGKEGVVVRSGDKMVKIKQTEYLELHKLVTNASPLNVWRQLREGHTMFQIVSRFPDEFQDYIWDMGQPLTIAFDTRLEEILDGFSKAKQNVYWIDNTPDRAAFARVFKRHADARYFFLLLDEKPINDVLWSELRPKEESRVQSRQTQGNEVDAS